jgi:hypothetical protein
MKRLIAILSIVVVTILSLTNCEKEKDANGIPVKYYENVIGEGYIYYKYSDENIMPDKFWVSIQARERQENIVYADTDNYYHVDNYETDNTGKYTFRFLEKKRPNVWAWGEWKIMKFYTIFADKYNTTITVETVQEATKSATKENPQIISIDTIWIIR